MDKIQKRVQKDLVKGEIVLASTKGSPKGFAEQAIMGSARKMLDPSKSTAETSVKDQFINGKDLGDYNQIIIGLTDRRLLFWSANFFSKPSKLIASIERMAINTLQETKTKMAFASMPTLEITSKSGEKIEVQLAKIHHKKAKEFVSLFNV